MKGKHKMQMIQVFKTKDGKTFENRNAARTHELEMEAMLALCATLSVSISTGRPAAVLQQLLLEHSKISNILTNFRKKIPREKLPEQIKKAA
jgi:hypothetical protein